MLSIKLKSNPKYVAILRLLETQNASLMGLQVEREREKINKKARNKHVQKVVFFN